MLYIKIVSKKSNESNVKIGNNEESMEFFDFAFMISFFCQRPIENVTFSRI